MDKHSIFKDTVPFDSDFCSRDLSWSPFLEPLEAPWNAHVGQHDLREA
jgi:hypothetical protein